MTDLITAGPGVVQLPPLPVQLGSVTAIVARMERTLGLHAPLTSAFASDDVRHSTATDAGLATNPPLVLISGCKSVELTATTVPPDQPVAWSVEPNPATGGPTPTLSPGGFARVVLLRSDAVGTFAVKAHRGGATIVLNVVFARVKVDAASATRTERDAGYTDNGSNAEFINCASGDFEPGTHAMALTVPGIEVIGGGASGSLGVGKVRLGVLQNATEVTLTATYADGSTTREVPFWTPLRDSSKGTDPLLTSADAVVVTPPNTAVTDLSRKRAVFTGDSPTTAFRVRHPGTGARIQRIEGHIAFRTAVVSFSDDARASLVVHAELEWTATFDGDVVAGAYVRRATAKTASKPLTVVDAGGRHGEDAKPRGYETCAPNYTAGVPVGFRRVSSPAATEFDPDDPPTKKQKK